MTPSTEISNLEKNRGLPWIIIGVIGFAFYFTFSLGSVFTLFLDHIGMSKLQIGFLLSLSPFLGLLALVVAPAAAKIGYKRTTILSLIARNTVPVWLILTPLIMRTVGFQGLLIFIILLLIFQSVTNTIAQTAWFPWEQEYVPPAIRGKFFALASTVNNIMTFLSLGIAGYILGAEPDTEHFLFLMGLGAAFAMFATWAFSRVPGGAPEQKPGLGKAYLISLLKVLQDKNFMIFLGGIGLIFFTTSQFSAFIPLYMREQVGLDSGKVVLLSTGATLGSMLSAYLWGWLIDRYGSQPVLTGSLIFLSLLPAGWFLMPRHSPWSFPAAIGIAVFNGAISIGWSLGYVRQLYATVPVAQKSEYMAVYYACFGIATGISQFIGGWLLDIFKNINGDLFGFHLDPFSILFGLGVIIPPLAYVLLKRMQSDSQINALQMAGMFVRGNPLMAFASIMRYQMPNAEPTAIMTTERLGLAESPLTVQELADATRDPRFNVRLEAIFAIARRQPDPLLTDALVRTLQGSDPALASIAAWALSRSGDPAAIPALRQALQSPYRSVQAHSVRSLATLGDRDSVPFLLDKMKTDTDPGLRTACAAALGKMGVKEAVPLLLNQLQDLPEPSQRIEVALALARIWGREIDFVRLYRQVRKEQAGALAKASLALEKYLPSDKEISIKIGECSNRFARGDLKTGAALMAELLSACSHGSIPAELRSAREICANILLTRIDPPLEVLLLSIILMMQSTDR